MWLVFLLTDVKCNDSGQSILKQSQRVPQQEDEEEETEEDNNSDTSSIATAESSNCSEESTVQEIAKADELEVHK